MNTLQQKSGDQFSAWHGIISCQLSAFSFQFQLGALLVVCCWSLATGVSCSERSAREMPELPRKFDWLGYIARVSAILAATTYTIWGMFRQHDYVAAACAAAIGYFAAPAAVYLVTRSRPGSQTEPRRSWPWDKENQK